MNNAMKKEIVYQPEYFGPANGWGFRIWLKKDFALKCREIEIGHENQSRFQELGREEVQRVMELKHHPPYHFVEDSLLIQSVYLPKNACCISCGSNSLDISCEDDLCFEPHNVLHRDEACTLLALFDFWVRHYDAFRP